jgi:putative chitinase
MTAQSKPGVHPAALRKVCPNLTVAQSQHVAAGLTTAFARFHITTRLRAAAAVAQFAHESDGFRTSTEYASGAAYEGRRGLGNTMRGDGVRFKGRGRIMITGRSNYAAVSRGIGVDALRHPEKLAESPWSELASAWWWSEHGCNALADRGLAGFTALTRCINGGTNGLASRLVYYRRARRVAKELTP